MLMPGLYAVDSLHCMPWSYVAAKMLELCIIQLQAGSGTLCMSEPAAGLCASLTQVCIVSTALITLCVPAQRVLALSYRRRVSRAIADR